MKKITLLLFAVFTVLGAVAQENDTTLLRKSKVLEVKKYQLIHAFVGRKQDTCLQEHHIYNKNGMPTYVLSDYGCSGYVQRDEKVMIYQGRKKTKELFLQNGDSLAKYEYRYNTKSELPINRTVTILATGDTTRADYTYYKRKRSKLVDSTRVLVTSTEAVESYFSKNTYDKKNNLLVTITQDSEGATLAETTYEWDKDGKILSVTNASFVPKVIFEQIFFKYDQNGKVVETNDTHNRQNIYRYTEQGLLKSMMSYNAKGELEVEYIYKYIFRK